MQRNVRIRRGKPRLPPTEERTLTIERIGGAGDGLAGTLVVPFTMPGDVVAASFIGEHAQKVRILTPSPDRQAPVCAHFAAASGACGGCQLQHLGAAASLEWKVGRVRAALARRFDDLPEPVTHQSLLGSRRRVKLALTGKGGVWRVGFRARKAHHIVDMRECAVIRPELLAIALALRANARQVFGAEGAFDVAMTQTTTGADVELRSLVPDRVFALDVWSALSDLGRSLDVARIGLDGVPAFVRTEPMVHPGGIAVELPPAGFLQATEDGEAFLIREVLACTDGFPAVADLFSGVGTFALPLAHAGHRVSAYDGAHDAVLALKSAARRAGLALVAGVRDLERQPIMPDELAAFDAVVFDPPRAGAPAQSAAIANAAETRPVPRLVAVACSAESLARDIGPLRPYYALTRLAVVDQFLFTPHVEIVAVLEAR